MEAVENHMPEIVMVDEIGTEAEALACRTIAERGVQLVATAHGQLLENLIKNPTLSDLVGGIQSVTLGQTLRQVAAYCTQWACSRSPAARCNGCAHCAQDKYTKLLFCTKHVRIPCMQFCPALSPSQAHT